MEAMRNCYVCDGGDGGLCPVCIEKLKNDSQVAMRCRNCGSSGYVRRTKTLLEKLGMIFGPEFIDSVRFYEALIVFTPSCPACAHSVLNVFRCYLGNDIAASWLIRNYELRAIFVFSETCFSEECRIMRRE